MSKFDGSVHVSNGITVDKHVKMSKTSNHEERELFCNEALFLSRANHPHIVKLVDCGVNENGKAHVATEKLFPNHKVTDICSKSRKAGDDLVLILNVLDFLSFLGLAHGDIKPEHLLRDKDGNLILIDYAQVFSLSKKVLIGTSAYLAPELFWQFGYSIQSDLFSLGLSFVEMYYQNETVLEFIGKYGVGLKPWDAQDVYSLKSSLSNSNALVKNLKRMISYSPLDRPRSGREIARTLIDAGESNWTIEQYDEQIKKSVSSYINRTHWIYLNNPVYRKSCDSTIKFKRCHKDCQASFVYNYNIVKKFFPKSSMNNGEFLFGSYGVSICRGKYFRGQIPLAFPKSVSIPSSINNSRNLSLNPLLDGLTLDYDFYICYPARNKFKHSHHNVKTEIARACEHLKELTLQRNSARGLELINLLLESKNLSKDEILILLSSKGYFFANLGQIENAETIFNDISRLDTKQYSASSLIEYCSAFGWYSFIRGNTKQALNQLENAIELLKNCDSVSELSKAILYNRLGSVKWLTSGALAAIELNDKALESASKINKGEVLVSILLNRCMYLGDAGDLAAERSAQELLYERMSDVKSLPLIINYLHNFAAYSLRTGDCEHALAALERAYALASTQVDSSTDTSHILSLLGNAFLRSNNMGRAFTAWQQASRQFMKLGNIYSAAKCLQNLAEVNFLSDKPKRATTYLKLAHRLFTKVGHGIGCCDTLQLKLWYSDSEQFKIDSIKTLLSQCQEAKYVWGEFHALWLLAIYHLKNKSWQQFDESYLQMTRLSKTLASPTVIEDLKFLDLVYAQVKNSRPTVERESSQDAFLDLIRRKGAVSFREQKQRVTALFGAGENILENSKKLQLLVRELKIEGRFMSSDKEMKNKENSKKEKDQSQILRFEAIRQIAGLVDQSKNVDEYISKVLELTVSVLEATRGAIFITSNFSEEIEILGTYGCKNEDMTDIKNVSSSLLRHALGGNSIFIRNVASERKYDHLQSLVTKNIKSAICIPLKRDNEVFGAVYVDSLHFATQFEDLDKTFLDTFGAMIAGGISTSYRLQKLNSDYQYALKQKRESGLKSSEGLLLPSPEMQEIYKTIFRASKLNFPILLLGQTGSGKDVLARMIHDNSEMNTGKFVALNCAAIPSEHLESELFGVAGKAFTSVEERPGKFKLADGGSLFLDEIADMPQNLQAKLLRVIETQEVEPVGGSGMTKKITFRLISATNKDIKKLVSTGKFREDLYHRINDIVIKIPNLTYRPKDIEVLACHYYNYFQNKLNVNSGPMPEKVLNSLLKYTWPGGIRELSKVVQNLVSFFDGLSTSWEELPDIVKEAISEVSQKQYDIKFHQGLMNKEELLTLLRKSNNNIREAARIINVPESTLRYQMKKFNIEPVPKRLRA